MEVGEARSPVMTARLSQAARGIGFCAPATSLPLTSITIGVCQAGPVWTPDPWGSTTKPEQF